MRRNKNRLTKTHMDIECESAIPEKDAIEKREFYSITFLIAELSRVRDRKSILVETHSKSHGE